MKHFLSVRRILRSLFGNSKQDSRSLSEADLKIAAEAAKNCGNDFLTAGNLDQAAQCFQEALDILPAYAEAYVNLGFVFVQQKRYAEAKTILLQAIDIKLELWQAHFNLGIVFQEQNYSDEAITSFERAIELEPNFAECHWRLGNLLLENKQYQQAINAFRHTLALDPNLPEVQTNLGTALFNLGRFDEALDHYRQALKMKEHHITHYLAGNACKELLLWKPAIEHYQRALTIAPDCFLAHYQLAFILLLLGDYEHGLAHFEQRFALQEELEWLKPIKKIISCFGVERYWRGQNLAEKRLLVITEQGLGDSLMLLRYLPLIKEAKQAAKLQVVCDAPLARLVLNLPAVDDVVVKPAELFNDSFDFYCTTMSLPYLFETRLENIPSAPYLRIPEQEITNWARRFDAAPGLKVGIAWAGNKKLDTDAVRSIPLRKFASLMSFPGITWINLQKNGSAIQLEEVDFPLLDWMDECQDFQDTGALMKNLDLIITVDTSVVHMAGALGRTTWLLNRYGSEWRWLLDREDSPWYPSVRIFRQPAANDWDSVIERIASELKTLIHL